MTRGKPGQDVGQTSRIPPVVSKLITMRPRKQRHGADSLLTIHRTNPKIEAVG